MADGDAAHAPGWGVVGTLLWGLLVAAVFVAVSVGVVLAHASAPGLQGDAWLERVRMLELDGRVVALSTLAATLVCVPLLAGIVRGRATLRSGFALHPVPLRALVRWLLVLAVLLVANDLLSVALGRPVVPESMQALQRSADPAWLLWLAVLVAAPLFEEAFFRGFLYQGLSRSALGVVGTIVLTALAWTALHQQYGLYEMAWVFISGLLLGVARWRTGSLLAPLVLHVATNAAATVQMALLG